MGLGITYVILTNQLVSLITSSITDIWCLQKLGRGDVSELFPLNFAESLWDTCSTI